MKKAYGNFWAACGEPISQLLEFKWDLRMPNPIQRGNDRKLAKLRKREN